MKRPIVAVLVVAAGVLVACGGDGGTHTQSVGPDPTTSTGTPRTKTPPPSTRSQPMPSWSPPSYGRAQPAVDAYLAWVAAANAGLANPVRFSPATAAKLSAGEAQQVLVGSIADEKRHGRAWRGTPWSSRVLVVSTNFHSAAPEVVLSDCPAVNNSWTEYDVATGKRVPPGSKARVPPPNPATIKVFHVAGSKWLVTSYTVNGSKTCTR